MRSKRTRESGQAAVESALVLPLFVFLILGIIQLGLMHQARLMTKYAAYKAVRAGSIWNAQKSKMSDAALAALLPVIAKRGSGADYIPKTAGASNFMQKWMTTKIGLNGRMTDWPMLNYVDVETCGPLKTQFGSKKEVDVDDPAVAFGNGDWIKSTATKLRAQVTLNYRLIIPFANVVIHGIYTNMGTNPVLRLGKDGKDPGGPRHMMYATAAMNGIYIIPIRATYVMRMQSNIYTAELPGSNACKFSFSY